MNIPLAVKRFQRRPSWAQYLLKARNINIKKILFSLTVLRISLNASGGKKTKRNITQAM
jgi:hypothetical protein